MWHAVWPSSRRPDPWKQYFDWVNDITGDLPLPLLGLARTGMWIAYLTTTIAIGLIYFMVFAIIWTGMMELLIALNPGQRLFEVEFLTTAALALWIAHLARKRFLRMLFGRKEDKNAGTV
jgi:hypothetical protein